MEWDSTHFNLKTFDIVMTPAFSTSSIPITIFPSRQKRRKEKIQNIFKLKNLSIWEVFFLYLILV
jgi:hypothetical protein